jgi:glutamate-ammonia-ligase adenylyltransferase
VDTARTRESAIGRLARAGFVEPSEAWRLLHATELDNLAGDPILLDALARTADPDLALTSLIRLLVAAEATGDAAAIRDTLAASKPLRDRLLTVLGVSAAFGEHLTRHPQVWRGLVAFDVDDLAPAPGAYRRFLFNAVGAPAGPPPDPRALLADTLASPGAPGSPHTVEPLTGEVARDALRVAYRECLLRIAARDLCGVVDVQRVAAELAELADATLQAALAIASAELPDDARACRLAVIGMGKCGGMELNYVSDVDVVFVAEPPADSPEGADSGPAIAAATRLAACLMRVCSDTTAEGTIWPVDAALRPEGRAGPLVRSLASHLAYYQRWAKTWEFQALLKARPVAGDAELGAAYLAAVGPLVWSAAERENFVPDVQAMRRRVIENVPAGEADRELKLGPGGLRDVEFAVQLLQLVHGRNDESLRDAGTLPALAALAAGGYVGRTDAAELDDAYRFLRGLEHRLQLYQLRRTHTLPEDATELRRLGRSLGFTSDPAEQLRTAWRRHAREVLRLHEKLFYRPLLAAVARLPSSDLRLTPKAASARLAALGYRDPDGALRHLQALTTGVSRRAAIQRTLLPVMLEWFADAADPDGGLLAFRRVSDALGNTHWYLRLLRDEGAAANRLARVLASGRYAADLLLRAPEAVAILGSDEQLVPREAAALRNETLAAVRRGENAEQAAVAARAIRRRELFRIATADLLGTLDVDALGAALTAVTSATIEGALAAAIAEIERRRGGPLGTRVAVIAMGRFGGHELSYASDADVMFVHRPDPGTEESAATSAAHDVVNLLRGLLQRPTPDPPLVLDADLRPEGRQGPLVRTIDSYAAYYERWALVWERQALLRAEPVAGDAELGRDFVALIDPHRYREGGLSDDDVHEIRRIKARVEAERLPRGADRALHTKLGPGGLADIEWTVQLLQLAHAGAVPGLRTTETRRALRAAIEAGLIDRHDAEVLDEAWTSTTRTRNGITLVRGKPADVVPIDVRELAGLANYLGSGESTPGELVDTYRRHARRARAVVERVFYG